jgi:hypothetical protein
MFGNAMPAQSNLSMSMRELFTKETINAKVNLIVNFATRSSNIE